ncbi:chloride channel protein [Gryllotalpicola sp.]|uniref:chloride channel protein n=1 Tax=Gryllotalpicola sp. TaxID=1932787 RepID=UPI002615BF37|nr:chloride channel protein [Gryllotalpicola sp.]
MTDGSARFFRLALATLVVGLLVGAASALIALLLRAVEWLAWGYAESSAVPGADAADPWRRLIAVVAAGVVVSVGWWLLRGRATAVPSVAKAVDGERMPWWQTLVHVALQGVHVGAGASIGREVAPRELGALIGGWFADVMGFDARHRRVLAAAAAGAGLAGVYNVPLAGALFAVEILLAEFSLEASAVALGTSAIAALVASVVVGGVPFFLVDAGAPSWSLAVCALVAGPVFGAIGFAFERASAWAERTKTTDRTILWMLPAMAFATGLFGLAFPQIMGNGRSIGQLAFASPGLGSVVLLLVLFASKGLFTVGTLHSGASGGVLQPAIALGASSGAVIGILWSSMWPGSPVAAFALLGAAAVLAASQRSPFTAIAIVLELTAAPLGFLAPVGLAVLGSILTRQLLQHRRDRSRVLDL